MGGQAPSDSLKATITRLGFINLLAVCMLLPFSYALAPLYPLDRTAPREVALFERLAVTADRLPAPAGSWLSRYLRGEPNLVRSGVAPSILAVTLWVQSLCLLLALRAMARVGWEVRAAAIRPLALISLGFVALRWLAYPIFTQDMWFSVVWGRMTLQGANPYYELATQASLAGLPLEPDASRMTYGPLWALICAALALASSGSALVDFLAMKGILAAAWVTSLWLVARVARAVPGSSPVLAVCLFGWMPLSSWTTAAEGHNDVATTVLLLLWLLLILEGRHMSAPFVLMASALMKYVAIFLLPLEIWHACRGGWAKRPRYWVALGSALALAAVVAGLFARDLHFLDETLAMRQWRFMTPGGALFNALSMLGIPMKESVANGVVILFFAGLLVHHVVVYRRDSSPGTFLDLCIATLATALFTATGHVWPWFLMWLLGLCALRTKTLLARYLLSLALLAPFVDVFWLRSQGWSGVELLTVALYGLALPLVVAFGILLSKGGAPEQVTDRP